MRKRRSDRDREGRLLSWANAGRLVLLRKIIVFVVSECVREKDCGELIECAHKVMRDGFKVDPRKITCGGVCVWTKEGNLATGSASVAPT